MVERLIGEVRVSTFSAREDQLSLVARLWLERPNRQDRFWRGSLYWADAIGETLHVSDGGFAFESEEAFLRLVNAKLIELGGAGLRPAKRG
jgi:hypothetical protein